METKQLIRSIFRNTDLSCEDFLKEYIVKIDDKTYIKYNNELLLMDDKDYIEMCIFWD